LVALFEELLPAERFDNFGGPLLHEPEVGFVNQSGALESMVGSFLPQVVSSDTAQLFIDDGD